MSTERDITTTIPVEWIEKNAAQQQRVIELSKTIGHEFDRGRAQGWLEASEYFYRAVTTSNGSLGEVVRECKDRAARLLTAKKGD